MTPSIAGAALLSQPNIYMGTLTTKTKTTPTINQL